MENVQISRKAACALSALVSDIATIDTRARCSDKFFRQHFMLVVNTIVQTGTLKELEGALRASEAEPEVPPNAPFEEPTRQEKKSKG